MVQVNGIPAQHPDHIYTKHDWGMLHFIIAMDGDVGNLCQEEETLCEFGQHQSSSCPYFSMQAGLLLKRDKNSNHHSFFYTHAVVA